MRFIKLLFLVAVLAAGVAAPSTLQARQPASKAQFTACPLPIPACIPEKVFDFKTCRCVPRD